MGVRREEGGEGRREWGEEGVRGGGGRRGGMRLEEHLSRQCSSPSHPPPTRSRPTSPPTALSHLSYNNVQSPSSAGQHEGELAHLSKAKGQS